MPAISVTASTRHHHRWMTNKEVVGEGIYYGMVIIAVTICKWSWSMAQLCLPASSLTAVVMPVTRCSGFCTSLSPLIKMCHGFPKTVQQCEEQPSLDRATCELQSRKHSGVLRCTHWMLALATFLRSLLKRDTLPEYFEYVGATNVDYVVSLGNWAWECKAHPVSEM